MRTPGITRPKSQTNIRIGGVPKPWPSSRRRVSSRAARRLGSAPLTLAGHLDVLLALTEADLRARYGRGPWRFAKWLLDPFALVGVYLVLVAVLLNRPGRAPGLSLACAVVPFQLLMATVVSSIAAIDDRRSIVANMAFPRILIPVAATLTESVAFAASLLLLAGMMAVYGIAPSGAVAWLPLVLVITIALATAVAYPASLAGLWVRDLRPFLISFVRTLFFLAPGLVALDQIQGTAHDLIRLNPLTGLFEAYRAVLLHGSAPAAWEILYPMAVAVAVAVIFVPIYRREQHHLAKVVE
jgi:homopolymeric O-antigen transport system permease protein